MNLWEKVGHISNVGKIANILCRGSSDSGSTAGEENVKISERWYVWRINYKNFTRVGKLKGEKQKLELL
ncbi:MULTISPECIES: hypothetical protein [Sphingobacterium]|jgi:hypothetical protein|uniref:hypothetical protein n=1 Tax=Sphingobacterium TaxID=28453 RepID=UPI0004E5F318|nr:MULTISPECIES: hypothetical protein [Sphingobacterium]CDS92283.1 conserved hypothetical protein [Sphingobacterium sp. PM2-P1-29]SJN48070.1 hypothetical protein FM120_20520 [Sphingobacterium faecium PCAi_F2.5]UPZ35202.1 hypothetical protein MUB18_13925 [Sphingobacterium sp. PCS056]UXD70770.1 hypothetical protein MUK51_05645 [Sphingobacterium faecium]WGQ14425.1 hypothetical protein QG727_20675 [Sphingobacterium faecium]